VTAAAAIARLEFRGEWRRYQRLALDAFERDRGQGRTHVVAPPGSGKTLLGVELVRRLGAPALVLVPNSAVQAQWLRAVREFGAETGVAAPDAGAPIACLTYQALAQLDDPAVALGDLAERRWAAERAAAIGRTPEEVALDARGWSGAAAARRKRQLARITASLKREIARAEHGRLHLGDLLAPTARRRLETLRRNGVGTVVLDECHHLASLWGYVVRAAVEELGDEAAASLAIEPRASGYLRCFLQAATAEESERFVRALDAAVSPVESPRYLVSRLVPRPWRRRLSLLSLALLGRQPFEQRWTPVPDDLGRTKQRAETFARAWQRWLGPGELRFGQRSDEGRVAVAAASAQIADYETTLRRVWV
jgi:hypothetical protein